MSALGDAARGRTIGAGVFLIIICLGMSVNRRVCACTHAILCEDAKRVCKHAPYINKPSGEIRAGLIVDV
jgi:hypothetical protein